MVDMINSFIRSTNPDKRIIYSIYNTRLSLGIDEPLRNYEQVIPIDEKGISTLPSTLTFALSTFEDWVRFKINFCGNSILDSLMALESITRIEQKNRILGFWRIYSGEVTNTKVLVNNHYSYSKEALKSIEEVFELENIHDDYEQFNKITKLRKLIKNCVQNVVGGSKKYGMGPDFIVSYNQYSILLSKLGHQQRHQNSFVYGQL